MILPPSFVSERAGLTRWLLESALPIWWNVGGDRIHGGFFEKVALSGQVVDDPRRTRVTSRQIYSYATGAQLGWAGPAVDVVNHGLKRLFDVCVKPDGTFVAVTSPAGEVIKADFDLYDQAFALFALAIARSVVADPSDVMARAVQLRETLVKVYGHPVVGFEESLPPTVPLKANPHMHLFEACLAWIEAGPLPGDGEWDRIADSIAELALAKFILADNGVLIEYFDADWNPMPGEQGRIAEPGHQFEWAWLLVRWGLLRNRADAVAAARRLIAIGDAHGTDFERGVAFNEIWTDLSPKDRNARLWPQTERIKAFVALARVADTEAERVDALEKAALGAKGLALYLQTEVAGLYRDKMREDGSFIEEAAPTSSLYHIICAIAEMHTVA